MGLRQRELELCSDGRHVLLARHHRVEHHPPNFAGNARQGRRAPRTFGLGARAVFAGRFAAPRALERGRHTPGLTIGTNP
jgi:hypothetical protein